MITSRLKNRAGPTWTAVVEWIAPVAIAVHRRPAGDIGKRLDSPRRRDTGNAAELTEPRGPRAHRARDQDPVVLLVERRTEAKQIEAPGLIRARIETQLRKRNPELCGPLIHAGDRFRAPHRIKTAVERILVVGGVIPIDTNASGSHAKDGCRAAIHERVERHEDVFGLVDVVAAAQRRLDAAVLAVHPRADIEHAVVVGDAHVHRVRRPRALDRLFLDEVGDRRGLLPGLVIEPPIDADRTVRDSNRRRLLAVCGARCLRLRRNSRR